MEVTATVSRPGLHFSGAAGHSIDAGELRLGNRTFKVSLKPRRFSGFSDSGHLQYYVSPRSGGKKKEKEKSCETVTVKKKLKLIKRLSKDLPMLSQMASGGGVETANGLLGEVKGKMTSEATEVLLAQLQQLRSEQKELKRERKEKKAQMKATLMKAKAKCESESSSSSSSESSNSECGEVIDMSRWRSESLTQSKVSEPQHAGNPGRSNIS